MATAEEVKAWILTHDPDNGLPDGVCPIIGRLVSYWHDWLGSPEMREEFIYPLCERLATSADRTKEPARREAMAAWLRDVALPAWAAYANLRPQEDLDDRFAEAVARNQGNGVASVNSFMGQSGVTCVAFVAANVSCMDLTKDRAYWRERRASACLVPKVEAPNREGQPERVSPLKLKSRCFRLAFCQPTDPSRTIESLQDAMAVLLDELLSL